MHDSHGGQDVLADLGYENKDVKLAPLMGALGGLVALIVVSIFGILWFYDFTSPRYEMDKGKPRWETERKLPPHPQIQADPKEEMVLYYKAEAPYVKSLEAAKRAAAGSGSEAHSTSHEGKSYPGSGDYMRANGHGESQAHGEGHVAAPVAEPAGGETAH
ncbi:MAG: hypothetical protein ACKO5K_16150 [Armatimonadota bacterium]